MRKSLFPSLLKLISLLCVMALTMPTAALALPSPSVEAATVYQPTWASVDQHNPAPEWFKDAKFGIYFHWGVFSVPAYGSEWYPRNMYNRSGNSNEYQHHLATFGDPFSNWPYHNFINGANDKSGRFTQFAPKLVSAGGAWDPNAWAQLFVDAGAKFAGPVAEHHDGFSMWNSSVNEWNSVSKGPKLDLVGQMATAIKGKGLKFFVSSHEAYNFTGYYQWVPPQSDPSLQKLYGQLPATQEDQLWLDKLKELIDKYQPDIIYHDFNLSAIPESYRLQFLAYYYNAAIDQNKEVLTTFKDGFNQNGELLDYERGGPADITSYYWLTDDAISSSTWGYTTGMQYYSTTALLHALIDRVSKNGNMILNISPMADGTIPSQQQTILRGMGDWLKKYGEAIYSTRAWTTYGEGPTKMGGGSFQQPIAGNAQDFRYTRSKDNTVLYAIELGWPGNGATVKLTSLASGKIDLSNLASVQLITAPGTYTNLSYRQDSTGLNITLPSSQPFSAMAYAFKLTFSGQMPAKVTFYQDVNYGGTAVALNPGTYTTAQLAAAGIPDNWASSIRVPAGNTVEIYDLDNLGGTKWTFTADNGDFIAAGLNDRMSSVRITNTTLPTPTPVVCTPTAITPYIQVNGGAWQQTANATVNAGASVVFGPQPVSGGAWQWSGPNGYSATTREITVIANTNATYTATYTNDGGCKSTQAFAITVNGNATPIPTATPGSGLFDPNAYYKIVNQADGKVIDSGGATTDGSFAKLWSDVSNSNQRWRIIDTGGGWYKIVNQADGKVLDSGGTTTDGSFCKLWSDVSSPNLRWQIVDTGGGWYKIVNQADGKVLDSGGATTDGSNVKLWSDVSSPNLRWQIILAN